MTTKKLLQGSLALICAVLTTQPLAADVVETKNGARIVGKIVRIADSAIAIETDFAGTIAIKQSEVTAISTDAPISVRLQSGTRFDGKVSTAPDGAVQIAGADGTVTTTVAKVAASWKVGGKDPEIAALERHWSYEARSISPARTVTNPNSAPRRRCGRC